MPADDARLRTHFSKAAAAAGGTLRAASVSRKKDAGPNGKPLSKGFGFVECSSEAVAKAVMKQLQVPLQLLRPVAHRLNGACHAAVSASKSMLLPNPRMCAFGNLCLSRGSKTAAAPTLTTFTCGAFRQGKVRG